MSEEGGLDRGQPVYAQLAAILRQRILAGDLEPGQQVPSKSELRDHYGVATGTVERAFALLRAEGLVEDVRGRGLFVMDEDEGPPTG